MSYLYILVVICSLGAILYLFFFSNKSNHSGIDDKLINSPIVDNIETTSKIEIPIIYDQPIPDSEIQIDFATLQESNLLSDSESNINSDSLSTHDIIEEPNSMVIVNPFKLIINTNSKLSNYENDEIEN